MIDFIPPSPCLLTLSSIPHITKPPPPCPPLTGMDSFQVHPTPGALVLHSITVRFGHSTQASREESQLRSGEHHLRQELVQANTQRAVARGADRPRVQILVQLHPV